MRVFTQFAAFCLGYVVASPVFAQIPGLSPQNEQQQLQMQQPGFGGTPAGGGAGPAMDSRGTGIPTISNRRGLAPQQPAQRPQTDLQRKIDELEFQQMRADQRQRNEFQQFVLQSTGRDLPLFGSDLFRSVPSTFAPVDNIPVTPDYTIGPGDELIIRAWGQIDVDWSAVVERDGTINVPKVGVIQVSGVKYQDLTSYLKTVFGRTFRNFDLIATLGQLRSIQVFVVGQARRPGTYTLSSLSSLVTAVFAAGGPSIRGSMRSIQLKRGNRVVSDLDLYDLIVSGDKSKDTQLLPGDVIYFAPIGPMVAVNGSVNMPAVFEVRQSAPLSEVIRWAGGLATTAEGQKVTVERIEARKARKVEEFPLNHTGLAHTVRDGDLVTVYSVQPRFDNAVTLRGNVAQPGRLPWRPGMRVRDLIPAKEALLTREYWIRRNQAVGLEPHIAGLLSHQETAGTRLTIEDLNQPLMPGQDETIGQVLRRSHVEAEASKLLDSRQPLVPSQGQQPPAQSGAQAGALLARLPEARSEIARAEAARVESLRLVNQIKPSLREVNWDYALVERVNLNDLTTSLIPFNLGRAVEGDAQQNLVLEPGDIITIFSREDIHAPVSKQTKYIRIEGEFNSAGVHQILAGETLRQLVARVGGFTPHAYLFGASFTRESTRVQQQKNLDEAINRLERDIQRVNLTRSQSLTSAEDVAALTPQAETQRQLIARLRSLRPTGRIVLELSENAALKDLPDLVLEDGDRFIVPSPPSMVNVFGSVYNENSFIYKSDKRVADYLAQAGGPTRDADRSSIYILRADGSVVSGRHSGLFLTSVDSIRLMPGDSIVVPEELERTSLTRSLKDISQIFYQFGLGAAAIRVLQNR